jgi:hypothetical protein
MKECCLFYCSCVCVFWQEWIATEAIACAAVWLERSITAAQGLVIIVTGFLGPFMLTTCCLVLCVRAGVL